MSKDTGLILDLQKVAQLPQHAEYYIPHRAPMLLLDQLVTVTEKGCIAKLKITEQLPFMQAEGLPSWVGIEIMAQTIAMYGGVEQRLNGNEPKLGFLLGAKKFDMAQEFFTVGEQLTVEIQLSFLNRQKIGMFDCKITTEKGVSTASLLVAQPDDTSSVLPM